jgi:hypothetical protein
MYIVAGVLFVLSGLFYAAGHQEIGSLGTEMCRYGGMFCDSPAPARAFDAFGDRRDVLVICPTCQPRRDLRTIFTLASSCPVTAEI